VENGRSRISAPARLSSRLAVCLAAWLAARLATWLSPTALAIGLLLWPLVLVRVVHLAIEPALIDALLVSWKEGEPYVSLPPAQADVSNPDLHLAAFRSSSSQSSPSLLPSPPSSKSEPLASSSLASSSEKSLSESSTSGSSDSASCEYSDSDSDPLD
jgi:hypothetical protein